MSEYRVLTTHNDYESSPYKKYQKYCNDNQIKHEVIDIYDSWDYTTFCWRFTSQKDKDKFEQFVRKDYGKVEIWTE